MDQREQGMRLKVRRKENYRRMLDDEGWKQLRNHLEDKYSMAHQTFLGGGDPIVSRETMLVIKGIFEEVGCSFSSATYAKRELEKILNSRGLEING